HARHKNPIDAGKAVMSAPVIRGLAATIRGAVNDLTKLATEAATELAAEVEGFKTDIGDVKDVTREVQSARADVRAALGQASNGGPPLEDRASAASSVSSSPGSARPFRETTPIGQVQRPGRAG